MRLAILASGRGSNARSLLEASREGRLGRALPVVLASNSPDAAALSLAPEFGLPAVVVDHRRFPSRGEFESRLLREIAPFAPEVIALAGFMRLLSPLFLAAFPGRVLNIHPSLLPAHPGLHAQRQALAAGARTSGCTVHLVDAGCDTGPILGRAEVPVLDGDDETSLAARILREEHRLYPRVVAEFVDGLLGRDR